MKPEEWPMTRCCLCHSNTCWTLRPSDQHTWQPNYWLCTLRGEAASSQYWRSRGYKHCSCLPRQAAKGGLYSLFQILWKDEPKWSAMRHSISGTPVQGLPFALLLHTHPSQQDHFSIKLCASLVEDMPKSTSFGGNLLVSCHCVSHGCYS